MTTATNPRIDHIGIAVRSIEDALPFYRKSFGLEPVHREEVASQNVRVAFLQAGETAIELVEPTSSKGAVARFLNARGPGLHHLAFRVNGIHQEMNRLKKEGLPPLEEDPRVGARGHLICFLHPRLASGVLIELVG